MIRRRIDLTTPWFVIADTHFDDPSILRRAGLDDSQEAVLARTEQMITAWNEVVPPRGMVMHAGDVSMRCKAPRLREILGRLNGHILLAEGSHDNEALKCADRFEAISDTFLLHCRAWEAYIFVAHHCHKVWPQSHHGSWHIHGHSHGGLDEYDAQEGKLFDAYSPVPIPLARVAEIMATRPGNCNDISHREGR